MTHAFKLSAKAKIFAVVAVVILLGAVSCVALAAAAVEKVSPTPTIDQSKAFTDKLRLLQGDFKKISLDLGDVKKVIKNLDTTKIDGLLDESKSCIQALQSNVDNADVFVPMIEECYALRSSAQDELYKNIYPQKNCAEIKKKINEKSKKDKKNLERQIKDLLRTDKNLDVSALRETISQMDALFAQADLLNCSNGGENSLEQINEELSSLFSDFGSTYNGLQNKASNKSNFESMVKRPCADTPAYLNKLERQMKAKAKKYPEIYGDVASKIGNMREIHNQQCGDLVNQMKAALQNNDTDAYNDAYSTFNDLGAESGQIRSSFDEAEQQIRDIENVKNIGKELKKQISELKARKKMQMLKYKKAYARASKKVINSEDQKKNLDAFDKYIGQADELLAKMTDGLKRTKLAQNNPDSVLVEEIREMQNEYSEMQQEWIKLTNIMSRLVPGIEGMMIAEPFGGLESIRRATNNDQELMSILDGIASQANDLLNQAWKIAITSPDEAFDLLMSRQDLHIDWTDAADAWKESHGIEEFDYSGGQPSSIPSSPSMGR
ncbi:hypothetical protein HZC21_03545 [Candidatus Peregrinibacteria bacterium]|nr:hypothetical protein [Candidatus Peregrinibacteria bacterium]